MSAHHTTSADWIANDDAANALTRFGGHFRDFADVFKAGIEASSDYRRLSNEMSAEKASRLVFEKHFSK